MNVSIGQSSPNRKGGLTLAAKSIVRSKTIDSGSITLVIDPGLQGGEGDKVIGRGVLDPLATAGSSSNDILYM